MFLIARFLLWLFQNRVRHHLCSQCFRIGVAQLMKVIFFGSCTVRHEISWVTTVACVGDKQEHDELSMSKFTGIYTQKRSSVGFT